MHWKTTQQTNDNVRNYESIERDKPIETGALGGDDVHMNSSGVSKNKGSPCSGVEMVSQHFRGVNNWNN